MRLLLLAIIILSAQFAHGQKTGYKTYKNAAHQISFRIPTDWEVRYSKAQGGLIGVPVTKAGKELYTECFEGIAFRIYFYPANLAQTLMDEGYSKVGNRYYTTDRMSDSVAAEQISGKGWTGIYHNNVCGISCRETGFHAGAGSCEFLYCSDGKRTVCITTNGRQFDDAVLQEIIRSLSFNAK
ncbi:MAG: hypothetical protein EOP49_32055 [Sphingobacteriales bacterium]|nr:MAG: hypothetical protein EOP49_32055 [Sphingobacteriales bacterium]